MTNETVPVVQGDRDAAEAAARALEIEDWATGSGYFAAHLVQDFARYRLSVIEECAGVCDTYVTLHSNSDTVGHICALAGETLARQLRALATEGKAAG